MKRVVICLLFLLSLVKVHSITGGYDYYIFYASDGKPYLEIYYWVEGRSIQYKPISDTKKQGQLEVTIIIGQEDTSKVYSFDKINLLTLEFNLQDSLMSDVYNVKRIMIPEGTSFLEVFIKDLNGQTNNSFSSKDTLIANSMKDASVFVTNIQLIDFVAPTDKENRFSKGGYDILPYHGNFYSSDKNKFKFYTEIVNADKTLNPGGKYLVNCYIEDANTGLQLDNFFIRKRMIAESHSVMLSEFPINNLGPGVYNFVVEVRDSLNKFRTKESVLIIRENLHVALT